MKAKTKILKNANLKKQPKKLVKYREIIRLNLLEQG